jgi:hypothetical protein
LDIVLLDIKQNMQFRHDGAQPISVMLPEITLRLPALGSGFEGRDHGPGRIIHKT